MAKKAPARKSVAKKGVSMKTGVKAGMALAGAAALAAAGYYYFYAAKDGAKRRKKVTDWSTKMKREVVAKSRDLQELNERSIKTIVKNASKAYAAVQSIDRTELTAAVKELQNNWEAIKREAEKNMKAKAGAAKKAVKKAVKKATKKAAK